MSWLDRLLGRNEGSGQVAKQRLQMVRIHDRAERRAVALSKSSDGEQLAKRVARHQETILNPLDGHPPAERRQEIWELPA